MAESEDGAVAIVAGLLLAALILMAAFVLDLAALRADRTASQSVADMAAAAGAVDFDPIVAGEARAACEDAIAFASSNLRVAGTVPLTAVTSCATAFPATSVCPAGPFNGPAVYERGQFRIEIVYPVPDPPQPPDPPDPSHIMGTQEVVAEIDGVPCERIGVRILRTRGLNFAPIAGLLGSDVRTESSTSRVAVARSYLSGRDGDYASLVVLKRMGSGTNCRTINNGGSGKIRVLDLVRDEIDPNTNLPVTKRYPGIITVDTAASACNGGQKVIDASTSTGALIHASGRIVAHALSSADASPYNQHTYPTGAVPTNLRAGPSPGGPPEAGPMITRSPVDHVYNCQKGGYGSTPTWGPSRSPAAQPIPPCSDDGPDIPYIQRLRNALDPISTPASAASNGFAVWPTGSQTCANISADLTPADYGGNTKLFFNCNVGSGSDQFGPTDLRLTGFTHVAFRRGITVGNNERLEITGPPDVGTVVYIRERGVAQSGGHLLLNNVFTYIDGAADSESGQDVDYFRATGTTERFALKAVLESDATEAVCAAYVSGAPPAACFAPLALWSNSAAENRLRGGGNGGVIGSIFTPRATFSVAGSSTDSDAPCTATVTWNEIITNTEGSINLESAQFFAHAFDVFGGGTIRMCPNPDTSIAIPLRGSGLIR